MQKNQTGPFSHKMHKNNKDTNVRHETIIIVSQNPLHAKDFAVKLMEILQFISSRSTAAHLSFHTLTL